MSVLRETDHPVYIIVVYKCRRILYIYIYIRPTGGTGGVWAAEFNGVLIKMLMK